MSKTKKSRTQISVTDKKKMWQAFDETVHSDTIECVYDKDDNIGDRDDCKVCGHKIMLNDLNFLTCSNSKCGIMYKDVLDFSAEWRYYGADDNNSMNPTRCGMPVNPNLRESSFGCKVLCGPGSSYESRKVKRYTEWQAMPYKEKSQYDEFQRISIMANQSEIPKIIVDDATRFHKMISEKKTFRGLNRDGIIAASIYIASRVNNNPRTPKEIAEIFNLDYTSATKGCKNAVTIINELDLGKEQNEKTNLCKTTPDAFIHRYCSKLNLNEELTKLCVFISMKIYKQNMIPENTPHAIAAGIVYFVSQVFSLSISKMDINKITNISEVTINKCYKKLDSKKDALIPSVFIKKYIS